MLRALQKQPQEVRLPGQSEAAAAARLATGDNYPLNPSKHYTTDIRDTVD